MRKLVAGNWKMNGLLGSGLELAETLAQRAATEMPSCAVLLCPPATLILPVGAAIEGSPILLGGQDCHGAEKGAHTGDISAAMLRDAGCSHVILGHSERRADHGETDAVVRAKLAGAQAAGLIPILCIGETLAQHDAGDTLAVVAGQLAGSLPEQGGGGELVVAYEPIWAIGSGRTPTVAEIAAVHRHIREKLAERLADAAAVPILYGGSVKPGNARELMRIANVDGALVGGASLVAADFWEIARACA